MSGRPSAQRADDLTEADAEGNSPLMLAACADDGAAVDRLLAAGALVNHLNHRYEAALGLALRAGHYAVGERLIAAGADLDRAIRQAIHYDRPDMAAFLLERGAPTANAARMAIRNARPDLLQLLLDSGRVDLETPGPDGHALLMHALMQGHGSCVPPLVAAGADPGKRDADGNTALIRAALIGDVDAVSALIEAGAALSDRNAAGESALPLAVREGRRAAADRLYEAGARGLTAAFDLAATCGRLDMADWLFARADDDPALRIFVQMAPMRPFDRLVLEHRGIAPERLAGIRATLDRVIGSDAPWIDGFHPAPQADGHWRTGFVACVLDMLEHGHLGCPCPCCGRQRVSRESYPVLFDYMDAPTFYRFDCCTEFHIVLGWSPTRLMALTAGSLVIGFYDQTRPYGARYTWAAYRAAIEAFDTLKARHADRVARYAASMVRKPVFATGFNHNIGHHTFSDLPALHRLEAVRDALPPLQLAVGPYDYFGTARLIGEGTATWFGAGLPLDEDGYLSKPAADALSDEVFRHALDHDWFWVRGTLQAEVPRAYYDRIAARAATDAPEQARRTLAGLGAHRPLVMITLRTGYRRWVGAVPGLAALVGALLDRHPGAAILWDGVANARPLMDGILSALGPSVPPFADLLNAPLSTKLLFAQAADAFVAPYSSVVALLALLETPGVVYGRADHMPAQMGHPMEPCLPVAGGIPLARPWRLVEARPVTSGIGDWYDASVTHSDYEVDWMDLHRALAEILGNGDGT